MGVVRVRITYQSVSGRKYETIVKFKDGKGIVGSSGRRSRAGRTDAPGASGSRAAWRVTGKHVPQAADSTVALSFGRSARPRRVS